MTSVGVTDTGDSVGTKHDPASGRSKAEKSNTSLSSTPDTPSSPIFSGLRSVACFSDTPQSSTLKRAFFGDTDDELTDLSEDEGDDDEGGEGEGVDEQEEGVEEGTSQDAAYDGNEPDASDDEKIGKPSHKRAKTASGSGGKAKAQAAGGKAKAKGKGGKKGKSKAGKGKGKGKAEVKEDKAKRQPQVDPVDGRLIARRPEWNDIPDWKGKKESPLMQMPAEIMDRCFGLAQDIDLRVYIALAGVSRYFRQFLDNDFFHHLWYLSGKPNELRSYTSMGLVRQPSKTKYVLDEASQKRIAVPDCPAAPPGYAPFSRTVSDVYAKPTSSIPIRVRDKKGNYRFYHPAGPREAWTKAQYSVYIEERRKWTVQKIKDVLTANAEAAKEAELARKQRKGRHTILVGKINRTVLAMIPGRLTGEKAIEKDDKGMPVSIADIGQAVTGEAEESLQQGEDEHGEEEEEAEPLWSDEVFAEREKAQQKLVDKAINAKTWVVPGNETKDANMAELRSLVVAKYDKKGEKEIFDHWPSTWRARIADEVNNDFVNLTAATTKYGVSRSEMITLRHWLTTNPMSTSTPQQIFRRTAVECLAWRAHGVIAGHAVYLQQRKSRKDKLAAIRAEKERIAEEEQRIAEENGTWVEPPPKRKRLTLASWEYHWRRWECRFITEKDDSCNCDYCYEEFH